MMSFPEGGFDKPRLYFSPTTTSLSLFLYLACLIPLFIFIFRELSRRRREAQLPRGCRRLGAPNFSNLADEYKAHYSQALESGKDEEGVPRWRVKSLTTYPIKSCRGVELNVSNVVTTGLEYDRQFTFAEYITPPSVRPDATEAERAPRWAFRTMRDGKYNKLALIRPELWLVDPKSPTYSQDLDEVRSGGALVVRYPRPTASGLYGFTARVGLLLGLYDRELSFKVPFCPPKEHSYPRREVRLWRDFPIAVDMGVHLPGELREYIGAQNPITLFRTDPTHYREVFRCAPKKDDLGFQPVTGFADAYPLHMLNLASVRDIGKRAAYAIPRLSARRFRANVVIQGPGAYEEDAWKRIRISGVEIFTVCRTVRCKLPNVDPDTGERHRSEPDKTMRSFRCIDDGDSRNACLGMQMVPAVEEFTLKVGDEVTVLEIGKHFYIKQ